MSLILTQNSEAELVCPTNIAMPNITFVKDGQPFVSRPVGKVGQELLRHKAIMCLLIIIIIIIRFVKRQNVKRLPWRYRTGTVVQIKPD